VVEACQANSQNRLCEAPHFQYHVSGTLHVVMEDGTEKDLKAGDISMLSAGHDAWVIGNEPVIVVDFQAWLTMRRSPRKKKNIVLFSERVRDPDASIRRPASKSSLKQDFPLRPDRGLDDQGIQNRGRCVVGCRWRPDGLARH